jgi:hypothetical protein
MKEMPVHPKYKEFLPRWAEWSDATAWQEAIKAGKETYLPRLADQTGDEYEKYLKLCSYYNATGKTADALSGALFFRAPSIALSPDLAPLEAGRKGLKAQLKQGARELTVKGRCGLLGEVDAASLPRLYLYEAGHIINWSFDEDCELQWVILREAKIVPKGEFETAAEPRYRVLQLLNGAYVQRVFEYIEVNGKRELAERPDLAVLPVDRDKQPLDFIPFTFIDYEGEDGEEGEVGLSPIADLAAVNIAHYQLGAELRHLLRLCACPMLILRGVAKKDQRETMSVDGSNVMYAAADGGGEWAEISGAGATAIREELVRQEDQMSRLGVSALRAGKADAETVDSIKLQQKGESSVLSTLADALEAGFTRAARLLGRWYGLDEKTLSELSISPSKEFFDVTISTPEAQFLFNLYLQNVISLEDLLASLQGGGVLTQAVYQNALERVRKATVTNGSQTKTNDGAGNSDRKPLQEGQRNGMGT